MSHWGAGVNDVLPCAALLPRIRHPRWGGHTGPRPSGSATRRKRPWPRASVSSGWAHRAQRRGGRLDGGNGTGRSVLRPGVPRDFSASGYFEAAGAAVLVLDDALLLDSEEELEEVDGADEEDDDEEELDAPPSFFVEL